MINKDTSPHDLITFLTSEPINYSTEITSVLSTTASKSSTTASISSATTKGTTTTEIILHSSDASIPELGKKKKPFF
jgi:CRISPR/Cas system-associated protein Csm6